MRRMHDAQFSACGAGGIRGDRNLAKIVSAYQVHLNQITKGKKQVLEELPTISSRTKERSEARHNELVEQLYQQI